MSKRVIINSDDFGITEGINKAIIELSNAGIVTSTTVMTNMPYYKEIKSLKNKIGIGVHLNLTEGKPVLNSREIPSLVDNNGFFHPLAILTKHSLYRTISIKEVENELSAQVAKLIELDIKPSHMDSHESFLKNPFFLNVIKKLGLEMNIKGVRTYNYYIRDRLKSPKKILISALLYYQKLMLQKAGFHVTDKIESLNKHSVNYNTALEKLSSIFQNLPEGVLEIVVHPGYCIGDVSVLGTYVQEREIELQALLSDDLKTIIERSSVDLVSYSDI